ncbi:M20/M25/M40 family metallo-hydrolase [Vibrio sinensis]|uniref:M20/M25/M40 family metallo-hydrolase n=1 Tax=Vibrio sinensis TaxID=2302434 RepID=A0A3A6QY40_9VIBR|nr:M20/M25/M40 family metallo-hydrolase [Vibrio sinensis]RJX68348.1 M20/M25/M40 family metallo-hydrolase [Vibrio sinensis]
MDKVIEHFLAMAALSSPSYKETLVSEYIQAQLSKYGIDFYQDNAHLHYQDEGAQCGNLIALLPGDLSGTIALSAHMDTVTPCDTITIIEDGDWIKTDGKSVLGGDDKAGIAVILDALIELTTNPRPHPTVIAIFTIGEEVGLKGAKVLDFADLPSIDLAYVIDAGGDIGTAYVSAPYSAKGIVTITGIAGHASEPETGCNAMVVGAQLIAQLPIGRVDEETTSNLGLIKGGNATNIIMESVDITFEVRSRQQHKVQTFIDEVTKQLNTLQASYPITYQNRIAQGTPGFRLDPESSLLSTFASCCAQQGIEVQFNDGMGGSDANIFNKNGIPCMDISVGMSQIHSVNECIRKSDIIRCRDLVLTLLTSSGTNLHPHVLSN